MLIDLTRTMFYKASFDIEADPNQDALWELVREIRRWLKHKAERDGFSLPWDTPEWTRIKNGETVKSSCGKVSLSSCLHVENSIYTWACALSEEKASNDGLAPRQWVTEVGFCGESFEKGEVSIVLSYGDRPGFIGELQEEPTPSIPGLVWRLIHSDKLRCSASGVPITDDAEQIENVDSVFNMIANPERETPVILLTPTSSGHLLIPPDKLATTLGPNAIVVYTCNSSTLCKLNALLEPYELECYGGALRVYVSIPDIEKPGEYARHRYISRRDIEKKGSEAIFTMLRRALAQDVHFWQRMLRIEDIKKLNRQSSRARREGELKGKYQDEALEEVLRLEREKEEAESLRDLALEENKQLNEAVFNLENRCQHYEQAFAEVKYAESAAAKALHKHMIAMEEYPRSAIEIAKLAVHVFPERIDFTDRGWKSLDDCTTSSEVLWKALYDMSTILYSLFTSNESVDIERAFGSKSTFEYKKSEGAQTRKDQHLMALRKDNYKGKEISIEPHIGSRIGDPTNPRFIRVYFAWDESSKRFVVGSCGKHLDNYTSKSLR